MPDIKVKSYGKSTIDSINSHNNMPTQYVLNREEYILFIEVDYKSKRPAVFIRGSDISGAGIKVKAIPNGSCGGFDFLTIDIKNDELLRYEWWGFVKSECIDKEINTNEQVIKFRVMNEADNLLSEERLPFMLIKNGYFTEHDAI